MGQFNQFENINKKTEMESIVEMALRRLDAAVDIKDSSKKEKIKKIILDPEFLERRKKGIEDTILNNSSKFADSGLTHDEQIEMEHKLWAQNLFSAAREESEKNQ